MASSGRKQMRADPAAMETTNGTMPGEDERGGKPALLNLPQDWRAEISRRAPAYVETAARSSRRNCAQTEREEVIGWQSTPGFEDGSERACSSAPCPGLPSDALGADARVEILRKLYKPIMKGQRIVVKREDPYYECKVNILNAVGYPSYTLEIEKNSVSSLTTDVLANIKGLRMFLDRKPYRIAPREMPPLTCLTQARELTTLEFVAYGSHASPEDTHTLACLADLPNLTHLRLEGAFTPESIAVLSNLPNLKHLTLDTETGIGPSFPIVLAGLSNLTSLAFVERFDQPIGALQGLSNLTSLEVSGNNFDHPIGALRGLSNLTSLEISGNNFDHPIGALQGLSNLTSLFFGYGFNHPIRALKGLSNLRSLTFGYEFNQPIDALKGLRKLENLEYLEFGYEFNQPIDALKGLIKLENLEFGYEFNHPIRALKGLRNLQYLEFGRKFNRPIGALKDLENLKTIYLDEKTKKRFENVTEGLNVFYISADDY